MSKVTRVIAFIGSLLLISGCGKTKEHVEYKLPGSIEHAKPGECTYITPEALFDSLRAGADMEIFFLNDFDSETAEYVVDIPGMIDIPVGDMFYIADTLSKEKPVYLICMYGDDSKRVGENLKYQGISSYYLDGGIYRLWQEMRKNGWKLPQTASKNAQQP